MTTRITRTFASILISFLIGFVISLANGRTVAASVGSAFIFSLVVGEIVALLSWAVEYVESKGYKAWMGFVVVLFLNLIGVLLLLVLPARTQSEGATR